MHADSGPRQIGTRLTNDRHLYLITQICLSVLETFTATLETQHKSSRSLISTANLVSKPLTMAPMALAVPAAASPATPPPMISTCAPTHQDGHTNGNLRFHKTGTSEQTRLGRRHLPRCRDLPGEKAAEAVGRQHDGFVPGGTDGSAGRERTDEHTGSALSYAPCDVGHGAERVVTLGDGDAGHLVHRQDGGLLLSQHVHQLWVLSRVDEAD